VANEKEYAVNADPETTQTNPTTGGRHFYLDSTDGVVHVSPTQSATRQDPAL
jgi:hypothetical protein